MSPEGKPAKSAGAQPPPGVSPAPVAIPPTGRSDAGCALARVGVADRIPAALRHDLGDIFLVDFLLEHRAVALQRHADPTDDERV